MQVNEISEPHSLIKALKYFNSVHKTNAYAKSLIHDLNNVARLPENDVLNLGFYW